jgi:hypothetical protein
VLLHIEPDAATNIHGPEGTGTSLIDLQTISLISLDFGPLPSHHRIEIGGRRAALSGDPDNLAGNGKQPGSEVSSRLENVLEHLFVGELLRCLWRQGHRDVEVLRTEVDAFGYDLVIETGGVLRHIQLKASHRAAKTAKVGIGLSLAAKPSGCVVWMLYDSGSLELGPFRWFGGAPGEKLPPLGDRVVKHTKGNAKGEKAFRPGLREVNAGRFKVLPTMAELAKELFGPSVGAAVSANLDEAAHAPQ